MILQVLTRYYEDLLQQGEIAAPGWGPAKISFALCLDRDGQVLQVIPTMEEVAMGKKTVLRPQSMILPSAVKRTVGVASNFLWDNSAYLLGADQKGKPERSRDCFRAAASLHHTVLDGVDSPAAKAILTFFDTWQPEKAMEHPALSGQYEAVTAGGNLLFRVDGCYPHEDTAIREAWQRYRNGTDEDAVKMQCLVTGREDEITATHPAIKGVRDAQSSGAALVSFNAPAFCSYGHEQGENAPMSEYAAFAYTTALNRLLADRNHCKHVGDTTILCWAENAEPVYEEEQAFFAHALALVGAAIGFTGVCICAQNVRALQGTGIGWRDVLLCRGMCACLCAIGARCAWIEADDAGMCPDAFAFSMLCALLCAVPALIYLTRTFILNKAKNASQ